MSPIPPSAEPFTVPMRALLAGARRKQDALLALARKLVQAESPSDTKAAVDACGLIAIDHARSLGGRIRIHRQRNHGNIIEARFGPRRKAGPKPVLILGHIDTVWPVGTLRAMPCRIAPDDAGQARLWGPGTLDMKVGVAMAFTALEMLEEAGLIAREIIILLNTDEEIGSPVSRPITERLALETSAVYVLEPAQGLACKTARKGTGGFRIEVKGIGAHAGVDFAKGANAVRELARAIETVSNWTDLKRGVTVSVGAVGGGAIGKSNVIPSEAWAEVDVRVARLADGPRMERRFAGLKPVDPRCSLRITGGVNRPPMERTRGTVALYDRAREFAAELGFVLDEAATGGASDGNFTSALGVPTLDGLGAVGEGAHALRESVLVEHLAPRTALLAGLLAGTAN